MRQDEMLEASTTNCPAQHRTSASAPTASSHTNIRLHPSLFTPQKSSNHVTDAHFEGCVGYDKSCIGNMMVRDRHRDQVRVAALSAPRTCTLLPFGVPPATLALSPRCGEESDLRSRLKLHCTDLRRRMLLCVSTRSQGHLVLVALLSTWAVREMATELDAKQSRADHSDASR
ncbi:hypothetical protein L1887_48839 [Cichorium endivia]|nr:hypothetical protein L1887_48839 [Cichorium endivia]